MMNDSPPEPDFQERIMVNKFGAVVAGSLVLIMSSATVTLAQTASSLEDPTISVTENDNAMDLNLAQQISDAWIRGRDVTAAVTFQIKGETALIQGDPRLASHYFDAAEHELTVPHPNP
jgi:hypothetical protein